MYITKKSIVCSIALLSSLGALSMTPAHAGGDQFTLVSPTPGSQPVVVTVDGGQSYIDAYTGRYTGSLNGNDVNIFCVDPIHEINVGQSYTTDDGNKITDPSGHMNAGGYYTGGLASEMNQSDATPYTHVSPLQASTRSDEVAWLADTYLNSTASTFANDASGSTDLLDNLSAVQLSIWDIIEDGGNGLEAGSLQGDSSTDSEFNSLVNYFDTQASDHSHYTSSTATWIQAPHDRDGSHTQSFVYEAVTGPNVPATGVPELSPVAILGLGLGGVLLAFAARRKRTSSTQLV